MAGDIDTSTEAVERLALACDLLAKEDAAPVHDGRVAATLRALAAENTRLREALNYALERGCSTSYAHEDDDVGVHGCCYTLSYRDHAPDCWTVKARAVLAGDTP